MNSTISKLKDKVDLIKSANVAPIQVVMLTSLLFYLSWQMLAPLHFLISDTGLRFIQIQELVANNWQTLAISYPQRVFDPELQHLPYSGAALVIGDQIFLYLSPFFNIAAAYFYKMLGPAGLAVVPTLGAVLTAIPVYKLARLSRLPYTSLLLWATVIATPILIYSVKLWDHTLATALATWTVYLIVRGLSGQSPSTRYLLAGGVCLGLGLGQRPEMYTFALAVAGAFGLTAWPAFKSGFIVAAGGIAGAIPVWMAQWAWVGHPMGISVGAIFFGYGKASSVPVSTASVTTAITAVTQQSWRLTKIGHFLLDIKPQDWLATLAAALMMMGAVILVLGIRSQPRYLRSLLIIALLCLVAGYSIWFYYSLYTWLKGILPTLPLFALALIYPDIRGRWFFKQQAYKFVALTALFFLALMFIFWPAFGGFQWGSRYLLPVYPLLVYMAWHAFATYEQFLGETNRKAQLVWRAVAISLLLISVLLQFSGIRTLRLHHQQLAEVQSLISNLTAEIILTNHYMLGSVMAPLEDKQFFYVTTKEDVEKLAHRFAAGGIKQIAIIPGTYFIPEHPPLEIPDRVGDVILQEVEPLIYELR